MNKYPKGNLWLRLQAMCVALNPDQPNGGLLPAATDAQITEVELLLGTTFPEDLRDAYRHFNGMTTKGYFELFPGHYRWMPLARMHPEWKIVSQCQDEWRSDLHRAELQDEEDRETDETGGPVYLKFVDRTRIPVAFDSTVQLLSVDTRPPPAGRVGQMIYSDPSSPGDTCVVAGSFAEAVDKLVSAYERGRIVYKSGQSWVWADRGKYVNLAELQPDEGRGHRA